MPADDRARHAVAADRRSGAASAASARPSSGRPAPRSAPCCRSRCASAPLASLDDPDATARACRSRPIRTRLAHVTCPSIAAHDRARGARRRRRCEQRAVCGSVVIVRRSCSMPRTMPRATTSGELADLDRAEMRARRLGLRRVLRARARACRCRADRRSRTTMPCGLSSARNVSARPRTANFAGAYAEYPYDADEPGSRRDEHEMPAARARSSTARPRGSGTASRSS